ncbi:MAG: VWA domain-containing protein [Acidobacteriota bacterium]
MSIRRQSGVNPGVLFLTILAGLAAAPGGVARVETLPAAVFAQNPPQFRTGTDVVPVYATVRDKDRGFVLDLAQDDFELYDNGRKQTITQFTTAVQPLSAVVLIDGSGSMIPEFNRAIEGARNFVLRMLPEDRARLGSFADRVVLAPRFTSDRDALLEYLDDQFNLRIGGETHLWEALVESSLALVGESGKRVVVVMSDGYNFVLPPG